MTVYAVRLFIFLPPLLPHVLPEPECCDGSDELPGICPNTCDQVGIRHRELLEQEAKLRKTVRFSPFISPKPSHFVTYSGFKNTRILHLFRSEGKESSRDTRHLH